MEQEFVAKGGNTLEFGAVNTFGVEELRISVGRILLKTTVGGEYDFDRGQVRRVTLERRTGAFGVWFGMELLDGKTPDVFFGGHHETVFDALRDRGWRVDAGS